MKFLRNRGRRSFEIPVRSGRIHENRSANIETHKRETLKTVGQCFWAASSYIRRVPRALASSAFRCQEPLGRGYGSLLLFSIFFCLCLYSPYSFRFTRVPRVWLVPVVFVRRRVSTPLFPGGPAPFFGLAAMLSWQRKRPSIFFRGRTGIGRKRRSSSYGSGFHWQVNRNR